MEGGNKLPILSNFYGIIIKLIEGDLPTRALKLIQEWIYKNKNELLEIWKTQSFKKIPPLK